MTRSLVEITVAHAPGGPLVRLDGEVDMTSAPRLRAVFDQLLSRPALRRLVVDLRGSTFFGSPGLAALVTARNRLDRSGGELVVVLHPGSVVDRAITLAGLRQIFTVVDQPPQ